MELILHAQRQAAQVLAVEHENIEGVELHLLLALARMQRIEIGDAVDAQDNRLAVDHELLVPVPERALDDPWETSGPVVTIAGERARDSPRGTS